MTLYRLIAPEWALATKKVKTKVLEGQFTREQIVRYNAQGYNVYYLPNPPTEHTEGITIEGSHINTFEWVFVDMDLKDAVYDNKEQFFDVLNSIDIPVTKVVDSGNGVHAYWRVTNLDALSYLRFQRRLTRLLCTDEAVSKIFQLMRYPGTMNTKIQNRPLPCELLYESDAIYAADELDKLLPSITQEDEAYCTQHFNRTYNLNSEDLTITLQMPRKFGKLIESSNEAKELWIAGDADDRSKNDYRLGHLMFANGFTKEEARTVLANSAKALQRAPVHRISYANNIIEKIWTFELAEDKEKLELSMSVKELLQKSGDSLKGEPFRCHKRIDNTVHGFRLGQVIGLVAGSGVGKTAFALNMFRWFAQENPDYHHFFVPLEQPANEIALRWKTMCGEDTRLHDKVHVISNYDANGAFRHLSFEEIKEYIKRFQETKKVKVGCVVIDHIGALKKKGKDGENQDLMDICHSMKAFAIETNTLLVMQSQSSREKAGIGDLELNKDAAYGTVYFESYCDYLVTLWQPIKRCHKEESCPTTTAFKFCKIRHKNQKKDIVQEDTPYYMHFDSETELLSDMTQDQEISFNFFLKKATNLRKADRKTDIVSYQSVKYEGRDSATTKASGD